MQGQDQVSNTPRGHHIKVGSQSQLVSSHVKQCEQASLKGKNTQGEDEEE